MLLQYYLQLITEICEGIRSLPEGISLHERDPMRRAMELQNQISQMGIPAFVRQCAQADGIEIPESEYENFHPQELAQALAKLPTPEDNEVSAPVAPSEPVQTEIRDIYEVFLDSVCLEDSLLQYLIDVCKRHDTEGFQKLTHAAARTILDMDDFLAWLGNRELLAPVEERACVRILDGCFERLRAEGQLELLAALLSGDEKTFSLFRCSAPELCHLPDATYEWFSTHYLDHYYPVRFFMKFGGVVFPEAK